MSHVGQHVKIIISGGRDFNRQDILNSFVSGILADIEFDMYLDNDEIVLLQGGASGADAMSKVFAYENAYATQEYKADWDKHGKAAGPIRNVEMANAAHVLIAFWDGKSKGTKHMIDTSIAHGLHVHVCMYGEFSKCANL